MTLTLFAIITGGIYFQLDTDELGVTNRYVCVCVTKVKWYPSEAKLFNIIPWLICDYVVLDSIMSGYLQIAMTTLSEKKKWQAVLCISNIEFVSEIA